LQNVTARISTPVLSKASQRCLQDPRSLTYSEQRKKTTATLRTADTCFASQDGRGSTVTSVHLGQDKQRHGGLAASYVCSYTDASWNVSHPPAVLLQHRNLCSWHSVMLHVYVCDVATQEGGIFK
jgi:hypothetical protein